MDLFDFENILPADGPAAPPPLPLSALRSRQKTSDAVDAYWKYWGGPVTMQAIPPPLPTLNHNPKDGHVYKETRFLLADNVQLEEYPVSHCLGLRVKGEPELISLYDAVQRQLVREVKE